MLQTRRSTLRLLQRSCVSRQRGYTSGPPDHGHESQTPRGEHTHHEAHPTSANESIGAGFYVAIAALFGSVALYKYSISNSEPADGDPAKQPIITRLIHRYDYYGEQNAARNALFTSMIEQAGNDRTLFNGSPPSQHIDLKFPEVFNTGSPWNVSAGQSANLDVLRDHYWKKNAEEIEKRGERLERTARDAGGPKAMEEIKEAVGKTAEAISGAGKKTQGR